MELGGFNKILFDSGSVLTAGQAGSVNVSNDVFDAGKTHPSVTNENVAKVIKEQTDKKSEVFANQTAPVVTPKTTSETTQEKPKVVMDYSKFTGAGIGAAVGALIGLGKKSGWLGYFMLIGGGAGIGYFIQSKMADKKTGGGESKNASTTTGNDADAKVAAAIKDAITQLSANGLISKVPTQQEIDKGIAKLNLSDKEKLMFVDYLNNMVAAIKNAAAQTKSSTATNAPAAPLTNTLAALVSVTAEMEKKYGKDGTLFMVKMNNFDVNKLGA